MSYKYEISDFIGGGTGGNVSRGIYKLNGTEVALKCIKLSYPRKDQFKRLYREISILKHLNSRFNLTLLDLYSKYDNEKLTEVVLVLPLMQYDLKFVIGNYNLIYQQIIRIFYQLLMGLNYLYDCCIIHRDLKPSNIGINDNLDLKILDFGLARDKQDDLTDYVVTRWYRPLEVFCISQYTMAVINSPNTLNSSCEYLLKVDMWSAGCIFTEFFTKKVLFQGKNQTDQSKCILKTMGWPEEDMLNKMNNKDAVMGLTLFKSFAATSNKLESVIRPEIINFMVDAVGSGSECEADDVINLIMQMVELDPDKRITPVNAIQSPLFLRHKSILEQYVEEDVPAEYKCITCPSNENNFLTEILGEIKNFKSHN